MQFTDKQALPKVLGTPKAQHNSLMLVSLVTVSAVIALITVFGLSTWAETSTLHHGFQHVLLFTAGIGVGSAGIQLLKRGKK